MSIQGEKEVRKRRGERRRGKDETRRGREEERTTLKGE